jgi:hypothetical protein
MVKKVAKKTRKTVTTKKSPVKRVRRVSKKTVKPVESFKVSSSTPFLVYRITQQTALWGILMVYIFVLSIWVLKIQIDTLQVIESINT